jgi:hypothetical protein
MRRYAELEREARESGREGVEIVLLGAESLDTIRATHAHYFRDAAADLFETVA